LSINSSKIAKEKRKKKKKNYNYNTNSPTCLDTVKEEKLRESQSLPFNVQLSFLGVTPEIDVAFLFMIEVVFNFVSDPPSTRFEPMMCLQLLFVVPARFELMMCCSHL